MLIWWVEHGAARLQRRAGALARAAVVVRVLGGEGGVKVGHVERLGGGWGPMGSARVGSYGE
jgi:hypothetical protein